MDKIGQVMGKAAIVWIAFVILLICTVLLIQIDKAQAADNPYLFGLDSEDAAFKNALRERRYDCRGDVKADIMRRPLAGYNVVHVTCSTRNKRYTIYNNGLTMEIKSGHRN